MKRRAFFCVVLSAFIGPCLPRASEAEHLGKRRKFIFKIKTEKGSIIGNIVIEGTSQSNAESKLRRRYPNCEILDCQEKD